MITRRSFLTLASGLLIPEPRRVYSFMPGSVPWPYGRGRVVLTGHLKSLTFGFGSATLRIDQEGLPAKTVEWPESIAWPGGEITLGTRDLFEISLVGGGGGGGRLPIAAHYRALASKD